MGKAAVRKQMIDQRLILSPGERRERSERAQRVLIESSAFAQARSILLYQSFRGEVETGRIATAARAAGKRLALPLVIRQPRGLRLCAWTGEEAELRPGAYGIPEPDPTWPEVAPGEVDLVVVPGVAFDHRGVRLGYGGGYYDRTLPLIRSANPAAALIGLAYAFQVVSELAPDPHDVPVDAVATEAGLILVSVNGV